MKTHFIDSSLQKRMIILFQMLCERNSRTESPRFCLIFMPDLMILSVDIIVY